MRMWMVPVEYLCSTHLRGEHVELHMLVSTINLGKRLDGFIANNLLELRSIRLRHQDIAAEMVRRGMNHNSPLRSFSIASYPRHIKDYRVDINSSLQDLLGRCPACAARFNEQHGRTRS